MRHQTFFEIERDQNIAAGLVYFKHWVRCLARHGGRPDPAKGAFGRIDAVAAKMADYICEKSSVGASTTGNIGSGVIGPVDPLAAFLAFLRPRTILDQVGGIKVPFNTRIIAGATPHGATWRGEGKPIPVSRGALEQTSIDRLSVAGLTIQTAELATSLDHRAANLLLSDLVRAVVETENVAFVDPDNAGSAGVKPAAITNGAPEIASMGASKEDILADLMALLAALQTNLIDVHLVMNPMTAVRIAALFDAPDLGIGGGRLLQMPVHVTPMSPQETDGGSPEGWLHSIVAVDASELLVGEDGAVELDVSGETSVQMSDMPTNDGRTPVESTMVNMFATNSIAIKALLYRNWKMRRAGHGVGILTGLDLVGVAT